MSTAISKVISSKELYIAKLSAVGLNLKEVCDCSKRDRRTVEYHLRNAYRHYSASDQATLRAALLKQHLLTQAEIDSKTIEDVGANPFLKPKNKPSTKRKRSDVVHVTLPPHLLEMGKTLFI